MRILPLDDATSATSGGKAAALATLRHAGFDVPDGFVIPVSEYQLHQHETALQTELIDAIGVHLRLLFGAEAEGYVAVRSSASDEDGHSASAAGQHDTVLAVRGAADVAAAVQRCWSSLHSPRAVSYRDPKTAAAQPPAMAVLVQRFIDADVSGVLFTRTPRTIEAVPGLGAPLVSGHVTPDAWVLDDTGVTGRHRGHPTHRLDRNSDRLVTTPLQGRSGMCLTDATAIAIDHHGQAVAEALGYDADIEWALTGHRLHTLQARPITAPLASPLPCQAEEADADARSTMALRGRQPASHVVGTPASELADTPTSHGVGTPASPGVTTGTARLLRGPQDFHRLRPGDILICHATDPAWTPLFRYAAGVITETGGQLSHAAIVARELGIPAVLGVPDAMSTITDGERITLDGTTGFFQGPN